MRFTQALHTYFRVGDAERIRVHGLDGLTYADKFDDFNEHRQSGDWQLHGPRDPVAATASDMNAGNRFDWLIDPAGATQDHPHHRRQQNPGGGIPAANGSRPSPICRATAGSSMSA